MLPRPPAFEQRGLYLKSNRFGFYVAAIPSAVVLFTGAIYFSRSRPEFNIWIPYIAINIFYLAISYFIGVSGARFRKKNYAPMWPDKVKEIDVLYTICRERFDVIENALNYIIDMCRYTVVRGYKVRLLVLDDGPTQGVETYVRRNSQLESFRCDYLHRPNKSEMKKAGNLKYGLQQCDGDFFAIFDADFCPCPQFLTYTIQSMGNPKTAIVQSPQFFDTDYADNPLEKGSAAVQELFYRIIEPSRDYYNAAICVGTNALYRREAFPQGTAQVEYSEDMRTGFDALNRGYEIDYVRGCLAAGKCPDTLQAFYKQQYRWCMGTFTLITSLAFWRSNLNARQKICHLSGALYYFVTALSVIIGHLPSCVMLLYYPQYAKWYSVFFVLPSLAFATLGMKLWAKNDWGLEVLSVRAASYWAHLFAIVDRFRGTHMPWSPTGSSGSTSGRYEAYKLLCCWYTAVVCTVSTFGFVINIEHWKNLLPSMILTAFNAWVNLRFMNGYD